MQTTRRMSTARQPTWATRIPGKQQQRSQQRPRSRQKKLVRPGRLGLMPCRLPAQMMTPPEMHITAEALLPFVSVANYFALQRAGRCYAHCAIQDSICN